jgi:hypothetical protein
MNGTARALVKQFEETTLTTLEPVQGKHFKNESVEIDGRRFTNCTFNGCTLIYFGGDVEFGPGCIVEDSRPRFAGPARRTVLLLHALKLLRFNPLEDEHETRL